MHWHSSWDENTSRPLFVQVTNVAHCIWLQKRALGKCRLYQWFVLKHFHYEHRENTRDRRKGERSVGDKGWKLGLTLMLSTWYSLQLPEPLPERQYSLRELAVIETFRPFCLRPTTQSYIWNLGFFGGISLFGRNPFRSHVFSPV